VLGGALLAAGGLLLVALTAHTPVAYLLAAYAVFGAGAGLVAPPITNTAVSGLPPDQSGVAGAIASTGRQFGVAVGVAVTGAIVTSTGPQFVSSSRAAWAVLAGCGILAVLLGLVSTGQWAQGTATRNGQRFELYRVRCKSSSPGHRAGSISRPRACQEILADIYL
jgi:MFS family permease